jgi:replicative DNA helicase
VAKKTTVIKNAGAKATGYNPGFLSSAAFEEADYPSDWLVEGILMAGQPGVIGGPQKTLKTSLMVDLAVSLGTGSPFLGRFPVPEARRVAVISGESGAAALQDLARRVARARKVALDEECRVIWSFRLPRLGRIQDRKALRRSLREAQVDVVFIDPLYLCLLDGAKGLSAANLFDIGPLLRKAGETCLAAGATPVFVHHSSKGAAKQNMKPGAVPELADLAFAGVAEYVRQWLLLARREPFQPGSGVHRLVMAAGGSAGHSGCWNLEVDEGSGNGKGGRRWQVRVGDLDSGEYEDDEEDEDFDFEG